MSILNLLLLLMQVVYNPRKVTGKVLNLNTETCSVAPYDKNEDKSGM